MEPNKIIKLATTATTAVTLFFSSDYIHLVDANNLSNSKIEKNRPPYNSYLQYDEIVLNNYDTKEEEINFYLAKHNLHNLLLEARNHIKNIFPNDTKLSLKMFNFSDEDQDILNVHITNSNIDYDEMITCLDKFEKDWWLLNIQKANQKLSFEV